MNDLMIGLAFMSVYGPLVALYIWKADEAIEKAVDVLEAFLFPPKSEKVETMFAGDFVAAYGEAVD